LPEEENALAAKQQGRAKVGRAMREFKHGQLKSGGRAKVKNPRQAIAIGLSEARRAGADVPPKKKGAAKKGAAKRRPRRKPPASGVERWTKIF
jgi:hypothetical protein